MIHPSKILWFVHVQKNEYRMALLCVHVKCEWMMFFRVEIDEKILFYFLHTLKHNTNQKNIEKTTLWDIFHLIPVFTTHITNIS